MLPFARTNSPGTYPVLSALTFPSMGPLAQQQQQSTLLLLIAEGTWKSLFTDDQEMNLRLRKVKREK